MQTESSSSASVFDEIQRVVEEHTKTGERGKKRVAALGRLAWPFKEQRVELLTAAGQSQNKPTFVIEGPDLC